MDAFEQVVSEILWDQGYWVQTSVKVNLTKEDKLAINRPSSPRWELDVVAYNGRGNILRVIECKSYLDSRGVAAADIIHPRPDAVSRYKLFTDTKLREVVFNRLSKQMAENGFCRTDPEIRLGLACGKVRTDKDRADLRTHFGAQGWDFLDEAWLDEKLSGLAKGDYENQVSSVVAKILRRGN